MLVYMHTLITEMLDKEQYWEEETQRVQAEQETHLAEAKKKGESIIQQKKKEAENIVVEEKKILQKLTAQHLQEIEEEHRARMKKIRSLTIADIRT